jgi:membrane protein DedA with SNARE-associated domain
VREPILRRGAMFVLVYHFAGYTRVVGPASAGLLRMPYRRWAPADYTGAALWVTSFMAVGYGLGALGITLDSTDRYFRYVEWALLAIVMVWCYFMYRAAVRTFMDHQASLTGEAVTEPVERTEAERAQARDSIASEVEQ